MRLAREEKAAALGGVLTSGESDGNERKSERGVEDEIVVIWERMRGDVEDSAVRKASYPCWRSRLRYGISAGKLLEA